ncbi:amidase [Daedalea quercina L-15889]|uniref:amidase n=1 Tax=Daedalea quercina L-15889 TaxID=1314783 RepID=A0A165U0Y6_9APHY|nr:amidase [Daedalea quercina L-15889]
MTDYETLAKNERARLDASIPPNLRLPSEFLANLPKDVSAIPETCGLLTDEQIRITRLDGTGIAQEIASGKITAVDAVTAVASRAAIAEQLIHPLTEFFLDEALERARQLDEVFKTTGKTVGPLHGVPISIKNQIDVKGHDTPSSFSSWVGKMVAKEDAALVGILRAAGAVFYCTTNMPQTIMHLETDSYMARTLNPYNTDLAPGGSSGGESSLIAMKGSSFGVGTDIGGSVRSPAAACGLYSLRPTAFRIPYGGIYASCKGAEGVISVAGPLARSARDVRLFMQVILSAQPWLEDPLIVQLPWRPVDDKRKLRVGYMMNDGNVHLQPPLRRALEKVVSVLKECGAELGIKMVEYKPWQHKEGLDIVRSLYFADGAKDVKGMTCTAMPYILRPLTEWVLSNPLVREHTVNELWELCARRDKYRAAYLHHWNSFNIDVLLCPVGPGPAPRHDTAKYWGYTAQWNLLDYPAAVFPTGMRATGAEPVDEDFAAFGEDDQINHDAYKPEYFKGVPLCLQMVSRRWNDELVMDAVSRVDRILHGEQ